MTFFFSQLNPFSYSKSHSKLIDKKYSKHYISQATKDPHTIELNRKPIKTKKL